MIIQCIYALEIFIISLKFYSDTDILPVLKRTFRDKPHG